MRFTLLLAVLGATWAVSPPVCAHEGHSHQVMGTVVSVSPDRTVLEIKDQAAETHRCALTGETKFVQGEKVVTVRDLKPGLRVVVTMKETASGPPAAVEVRIGEAPAATPRSEEHDGHNH